VRINANALALPNNDASNGVTHVVRGVKPDWVSNSIFRFVKSMSDPSILQELLESSGLVEMLNEFDIFHSPTLAAPTNSVFEALGNATLDSWRLPENQDTLRRMS
jgi:uncharacterized surface protein with fasciclin (FAS1) repeats